MEQKKILQLIHSVLTPCPVISLVGGGGKTTAMYTLASELRKLNKRVLVTTTTAIWEPDGVPMDQLLVQPEAIRKNQMKAPGVPDITVWGSHLRDDGKLLGICPDMFQETLNLKGFDAVLVEADGSRRKAVKAPDDHEPVIPEGSDLVIGVIGLSVLGKKASHQTVHRLTHFCKVAGSNVGDVIEPRHLLHLITSPHGLFKGVPKGAGKILMLNQSDDESLQNTGKSMISELRKRNTDLNVYIVTSLNPTDYSLRWGEIL